LNIHPGKQTFPNALNRPFDNLMELCAFLIDRRASKAGQFIEFEDVSMKQIASIDLFKYHDHVLSDLLR
jgi:hypothetical protein